LSGGEVTLKGVKEKAPKLLEPETAHKNKREFYVPSTPYTVLTLLHVVSFSQAKRRMGGTTSVFANGIRPEFQKFSSGRALMILEGHGEEWVCARERVRNYV
jgi:hypothetical protein